MVMVEGRGVIAPSPVVHKLNICELRFLEEEAKKRDGHRRYSNRRDQWGRGLTKNPILTGMGGEFAAGKYIGAKPDFRLHAGDNGIDLIKGSMTFQVKTRQSRSGLSLVRRVDHRGRLKELIADAFLFCQWIPGESDISLLGWQWRQQLPRGRFGKSRVAHHFNIFIYDTSLLPMSRLRTEIECL